MFERVGTIVAVAFILTRFSFFKNMVQRDQLGSRQEVTAILFFAMFGIAGTYLGFTLHTDTLQFSSAIQGVAEEGAIANSRVIGIVIAGLLGGYRVGLGAGLIAGIHRMTLGGFTGFACGFSTIIAGFLAGFFYKKKRMLTPSIAFIIVGLAEAMQMGLIVVLSRPLEQAISTVQIIGVPMVLTNGIGAAIFMLIIQSVIDGEKRASASEAEKTLRIANQTIAHFRQGLTVPSAQAVCSILHDELQASAVIMTNRTDVLAFIGNLRGFEAQIDHIDKKETQDVLSSGDIQQLKYSHEEGDRHAMIAPLTEQDGIIGTLTVYYNDQQANELAHKELIQGLSKLLSEQLEIGEAERTLQLAKEVEINALQAQINPHFLFNSMNIIISLIRTNPEEARHLLNELSVYIRKNVTGMSTHTSTFKEELAHVQAYLSIIEARFIDRIDVQYEIDFSVMDTIVPPLILQPLVENAVQHGFRDKDHACSLTISIVQRGDDVNVHIRDNGKGMDAIRLQTLLHQHVPSKNGAGIGLYNVNRRLRMHFGDAAHLRISSTVGNGTIVSFTFKMRKEHDIRVAGGYY